MAVVINGSGTVTGLAVGGLPDGTVDAGTLADDAVGLAQMASGTDGNLITYDASGNPAAVAVGTSGQVLTSNGAGAAPTMQAGGKVLQVVSYDLASGDANGQPTRTSTTFGSFSTPFKTTITPLQSDSDILITYQLTVGSSGDMHHIYFRLYDGTNTAVIGTEGGHGLFGEYVSDNDNGATWGHLQVSGSYLYQNPTISSPTPNAIEIEVHARSNGSETLYLNRRGYDATYGALTSNLILMEISA